MAFNQQIQHAKQKLGHRHNANACNGSITFFKSLANSMAKVSTYHEI
jgi:hypothetical protein